MNRGALSGFAPAIGAYNPMPTGGSYSGNRGRHSVDEIRVQGNHDNTAYPLPNTMNPQASFGAVRLFNTNPQLKTLNLLFPGDQGAFVNVLNGYVMTQGGFPPADAFYNTAGIIMCGADMTDGMGSYVSNTIVTNQPGVAATFGSLNGLSNFNTFLANGQACTVPSYNDIWSSPVFLAVNSGSLSVDGLVNFQATCNSPTSYSTGVAVASRTAFAVTDMSGGTATTVQVGFYCPTLAGGGTNTAIQIGGTGSQTLIASTGGAQLAFLPGTTILNYTNAQLPPLITAGGTLELEKSANPFSFFVLLSNSMTLKNLSTVTANLGPMVTCNHTPTIEADTVSIAGGSLFGFNAQPTFTTTNSGTMTGATVNNFRSTGTVSSATATVTTWVHYQTSAVTLQSGGSLVTQVGLSIPVMTGATYNNGIICGTNSAFGASAASGTQAWAIRIEGGNNGSSGLEMDTSTVAPTVPSSDTGGVISVYAGSGGSNYYLLITFNDGGTTRYKYLPLNGTGSTWSESTTLPT